MQLRNITLSQEQIDAVMRGQFIMLVDGKLMIEREWEDFVSIPREIHNVETFLYWEKDCVWQFLPYSECQAELKRIQDMPLDEFFNEYMPNQFRQ